MRKEVWLIKGNLGANLKGVGTDKPNVVLNVRCDKVKTLIPESKQNDMGVNIGSLLGYGNISGLTFEFLYFTADNTILKADTTLYTTDRSGAG